MEQGLLEALQQMEHRIIGHVDLRFHELRTELKGDINDLRTEMNSKIDDLRTEMNSKINDLRTEMNSKFDDLRTEMNSKFDDLRTEMNSKINELRSEMNQRFAEINHRLDEVESKQTELIAIYTHSHERKFMVMKLEFEALTKRVERQELLTKHLE